MKELLKLRDEIDDIDKELLYLFEQRMEIVKEVIDYKSKHNLPILNESREQEVIVTKLKLLKNKDLEPYVIEFFKNLMIVSKEYQKRLKK